MPVVSNEDYAAFMAWKAQGGSAPAPQQPPGNLPPTPTVSPTMPPPALKTWDPQKGWQGGPDADPNGPLPPPRDMGGGMMDYTDQNAEISRRAMAARNDPKSPGYISPDQQAQRQQANALYAAANPGWTFSDQESAWRWTGQGPPVEKKPWAELARDNPQVFGIADQGLYGAGMPAEQPAPGGAPFANLPGYVPTDPNAIPSGYVRDSRTGTLRPETENDRNPPAAAPAAPSAAGIGREGAPRPASPPPAAPPSAAGIGREGAPRPATPPPPPAIKNRVGDLGRTSLLGEFAPPGAADAHAVQGALAPPAINPPPRPRMPGMFAPPRVRFPGGG